MRRTNGHAFALVVDCLVVVVGVVVVVVVAVPDEDCTIEL